MSVQSSLVMHPINAFGSQEQKDRFLPDLGAAVLPACRAESRSQGQDHRLLRLDRGPPRALRTLLTMQPNHGSDPAGMTTEATEVDGGFKLSGSKTWISNSPIADVMVVWAKCKWDGKIRGFILEKGMKGLTAPQIKNKLSLRASITGSICASGDA